jgi:nucleoside-diphosphate-sugar epimerase
MFCLTFGWELVWPAGAMLGLLMVMEAWRSIRPDPADESKIEESMEGYEEAAARVAALKKPASGAGGAPLSPFNTALQATAAARGGYDPVPAVCVVTGGTGFVGQRLVEMLVERGARRVISFDIVPRPANAWDHPAIEYVRGDITDPAALDAAFKGADCVWHNAAAVGPFHPMDLYDKVNHQGTLRVIEACKRAGVRKCVMSSSPSTRFTGEDIDGLSEDEMPALPLKSYMQAYAGSKARGELAMRAACSDDFMTVAVAPHQVYGARDNLFMPNVMEAAGSGRLRVFASARTGRGFNRVCFTHVDNYAHGLIISERALYKGSPALGKFYIVTDGDTHPFSDGYLYFWVVVDHAAREMGFRALFNRAKLPDWFLLPLARVSDLFTMITGINLKLNTFNVRVLTMHRWFAIDAAVRDLKFKPVIGFREGWADTIAWFQQHWLPKYHERQGTEGSGMAGIASQSQRKIDIQAGRKNE